MKVLYVSQYFPPEIGAPAVRVFEMTSRWRAAGADARVLTGFPNHPDGIVPAAYRARFRRGVALEQYQGIPVYRTWLYPAANQGKYRRGANYLSFMLSAALRGMLLRFRPDVVIGTSPQLLCAVAASWVARRLRARFVMEVRDLWPESLEAVGVCSKDSRLYRTLDAVAANLYSKSWKVVGVTESFRQELRNRGVPDDKIAVVLNGVDTEFFRPDVAPAPEREALDELRGKFIVSYIGTHGMAHALETFLDAARLLADDERIQFLTVGGGARLADLKARGREMGLRNVTFLGPRPWAEMPGFLRASDVAVIHLSGSPLFRTVIPSKMFEVMAVGRPIVMGVKGEAAAILDKADAGLAITPESPEEMRDAVLRLFRDEQLRRRFGEHGRAYACEHASYEARARDYLACLSGNLEAHTG
ncbi:MAG: glycosyltransferase family 4 protein [Acidobacteria bacterium]|nr:glycosyltransferase family 4 protein [Acidobacteriota bacterium]